MPRPTIYSGNNPDEPESEFFAPCTCKEEGMMIEHHDDGYYFSYWRHNMYSKRYTWKQKLKYIFHVLIKGQPFADMVIMEPYATKQLASYLLGTFEDQTFRNLVPPAEGPPPCDH